jgi:hypothetical protein
MAEEAAKAQDAVKQKNWTLALPPAPHRPTHRSASRTTPALIAGGALFWRY